MPTNFDNAVPIVNQPFLYANGFSIINNVTTPNTKLDVGAGICRDYTNSFDINLGNYKGMNPNISAHTSVTIDATAIGINGLDAGSLAASSLYYIYAVADVVSGKTTGAMLSLTSPTGGGPVLPTGYNVSRHIGFAATDGSVHFYLMNISGDRDARVLMYQTPISVLAAGNATTFTNISLEDLMPGDNNMLAILNLSLLPAAASQTLAVSAATAAGNQALLTGQVASVAITGQYTVNVEKQLVHYKVSNSGAAATVLMSGFVYYI